ncbi:hypothetical protein [Sporolactobacillus mangiferae]|nr:hypothetical protein [Sporolactobacillus mangiferae]
MNYWKKGLIFPQVTRGTERTINQRLISIGVQKGVFDEELF